MQDQMMFCDRCDRGYHTFCVGLRAIPDGHWQCEKYCKEATDGGEEPKPKHTPTIVRAIAKR